MNVGVIGAGRMGLPIIGHLARKGFATLVHDIDGGKRKAVEERGAKWANDVAALAAGSDVVLVCVGYDKELRELFPQLAAASRRGAIHAVLSTVNPKTVQELAAAAPASQAPTSQAPNPPAPVTVKPATPAGAIHDDPTVAPDRRQSADNNVSFPVDI